MNKKIFLPIFFFFLLFCKKADYNPKLVDYLKAERNLRINIIQEQELNDSLITLQKRFRIDVKEELKKLEKKPEAWVKLLKALDNEKQ